MKVSMLDVRESTDLLSEFLVESRVGLDQLDLDLHALALRGADPELIGRVFRCVHTLKGTCSFLGFTKLESIAHVGENVLSRMRDGALDVTPDTTATLRSLIDAAREIVRHIELHGTEAPLESPTDAPTQAPTEAPADEPAALSDLASLGHALTAMNTSRQPIGEVWSKFPRMVRDLATLCGKHVVLRMDGTGTELHRSTIEAVRDPLMHIVRNAVDHGIEPPNVRISRNKRPEGQLVLRAFRTDGHVCIEVSDDGAGIDTSRLRAKAVESGILSANAASELSEQQALNLIFVPGLSTVAAVTSVSGRGVGMDVVRTNLEAIGGSVEVSSTGGGGTTLRMRVP